jgi:hypothetical protein
MTSDKNPYVNRQPEKGCFFVCIKVLALPLLLVSGLAKEPKRAEKTKKNIKLGIAKQKANCYLYESEKEGSFKMAINVVIPRFLRFSIVVIFDNYGFSLF